MQNERKCGILLHPTSLPGTEGIGTLGRDARQFIDLLAGMGMSLWQVLPLTPPACGNSPYSAFSAFAGNPLLIDLEQLASEGDLPHKISLGQFPKERVDFARVIEAKQSVLRQAAASFFSNSRTARMEEFWHFCDTSPWLHGFALFMALKQHYKGKSWHRWPADAARMAPEFYEKASSELGPEIGAQKYQQWQFYRQWQALRKYAAAQGIAVMGDLPIFVAYDSADVWGNRDIFLLDEKGKPTFVAGVPPDYFSKTGQLWGNPLYDWTVLEKQGYAWWIERIRQMYNLFDTVRIDHFRGFEAAWHVPAGERTAVKGKWIKGPGAHLFDAINTALGKIPIIAEDLGVITPEVEALRDHCGYPGMKILQFAFDSGPTNPYLPHNHTKNCVVYTGTHDNDTTLGWFHSLAPAKQKAVLDYLGSDGRDIVTDMVRMVFMSVADTAIIPFQDILGLPSADRMNTPGTAYGNWEWRFSWESVPQHLSASLSELLEPYGRHRLARPN